MGVDIMTETMTERTVTMRATYDCVLWHGEDDYSEWGGYCDPENPWGTADDEYDESDESDAYGRGEPIVLELPFDDAVEFIRDFPGAVWDLHDHCDASQNRTGVWTRVTLHVDDYDALGEV